MRNSHHKFVFKHKSVLSTEQVLASLDPLKIIPNLICGNLECSTTTND